MANIANSNTLGSLSTNNTVFQILLNKRLWKVKRRQYGSGYSLYIVNASGKDVFWSGGNAVDYVMNRAILPGYYNKTTAAAADDSEHWSMQSNAPGTNGAFVWIPNENLPYKDKPFESPSGNDPNTWAYFTSNYRINIDSENPSNRHYIFMLRPDLNIFNEATTNGTTFGSTYADNWGTMALAMDQSIDGKSGGVYKDNQYKYIGARQNQYFRYLQAVHPEILASLTGYFTNGLQNTGGKNRQIGLATQTSGVGNSVLTDETTCDLYTTGSNGKRTISKNVTLGFHTFLPYVTNRAEQLQLPDYTIKSNTIALPYTKYAMPYSQSAIESTTNGSFDIVMREDRWYSIHKLFYAWVYYQNAVMRGYMFPRPKYVQYNSLDYATSVYDICVDETGQTIIYWAKYTGCIPTSVPMSDMSFNRGTSNGPSQVTIPFQYFYVEHMIPEILMDFNFNSLGASIFNTYSKKKASNIQAKYNGGGLDFRLNPVPFSATVGPEVSPGDRSYENFFLTENISRPIVITNGDSKHPKFLLRWIPR